MAVCTIIITQEVINRLQGGPNKLIFNEILWIGLHKGDPGY